MSIRYDDTGPDRQVDFEYRNAGQVSEITPALTLVP